MRFLITLLFIFILSSVKAQSLAVNTDGSTANASSIRDIKSDSKGLLLPRMTKTQKNAIVTPATGLLVFQTGPDSVGFHYYNGTVWLWLDPFYSNAWKTTGNTGTDTSVNFLGTTDLMPIRFKQNNINIGEWNRNKRNYFIGVGAGNYSMPANGHIAIGDSTGPGYIGTTASGVLIGTFAGKKLVNGFNPVMIGLRAGENTQTGSANVFVGTLAGRLNTTGVANTYLGHQAGDSALTGNDNTAVGSIALSRNKNGSNNSAIGYNANVGGDSLVNATAIGALSFVDTSNALVLGSINGLNTATANTNVAIGTAKPKSALHISRGDAGFTGTIPSNRNLLIEDDFNSYLQFLTPDIRESGILAGSASAIIKSGLVFRADSSMQLRAGGNNTRLTIDNAGRVGIGTITPKVPLHVFFGSSGNTSPFTANFTHVLMLENSSSAYVTLMTPDNQEASIFSGNSQTIRRSSLTFSPDSSITMETGGPFTSFRFTKNAELGINRIPSARIDVNGTFRLGTNGTINTAIIKDTVSIDVPSMAANGEVEVTVTLANVTTNGAVSISPAASLPAGLIICFARVSAANTVLVRFRNMTAGVLDPPAINYFIGVVQ